MTIFEKTGLSAPHRAVIMRAAVMLAAVVALGSFAQSAAAQQPQQKHDDLDVTMQIIVDPDAKLPDEVVRRIPLPVRKSTDTPAAAGDKSGKDRDNAADEHGKEASQAAQERAREAAEQREAARRAEAEERKKPREPGPPDDRPDPPNRPPH